MTTLEHNARRPALVVELFGVIRAHRRLILEMTRRELRDRYVGNVLGRLWSVLHPLVMVGVYVFLFGFVFRARAGATGRELPSDYVVFMLSALLPWQTLIESVNKGTTVISSNANLVKQVVFPIEILPIKSVLASLSTLAVTTTLFAIYVLAVRGALPWTIALLPALWLAQAVLMFGFVFLLASLTVFFRDVKDMVQVASQLGVYTVPVVFAIDWVPELLRPVVRFNPLTPLVLAHRDVWYHGAITEPAAWGAVGVVALASLVVGLAAFRWLRPHFGNVL